MHGTDPEVGEDEIGAGPTDFAQGGWQSGEVGLHHGELAGSETGFAQALFRAGEFEWIDIESEQMSVRHEFFQDRLGVAAVAEGAVDGEVAGVWTKHVEDLRDHDRHMGTGGGFAGCENFGHRDRVVLRVEFLVFVLEANRVFPRIAETAAMRSRRGFVHRLSRSRHRGGEVVPFLVCLLKFFGQVGEFAMERKG